MKDTPKWRAAHTQITRHSRAHQKTIRAQRPEIVQGLNDGDSRLATHRINRWGEKWKEIMNVDDVWSEAIDRFFHHFGAVGVIGAAKHCQELIDI